MSSTLFLLRLASENVIIECGISIPSSLEVVSMKRTPKTNAEPPHIAQSSRRRQEVAITSWQTHLMPVSHGALKSTLPYTLFSRSDLVVHTLTNVWATNPRSPPPASMSNCEKRITLPEKVIRWVQTRR